MNADLSTLMDLQDDVLLTIFQRLQPLPDLFSVAATCCRFRGLAMDKRRWLRVSPNQALVKKQGWQGTFRTLEEAISSSRPGDTIWLAPHQEHRVLNVKVDWELHLRGGGPYPEDTILTCPKGADMGLDFRATCLLANVSVSSKLSPCILHRAGHLRVECCLLTCDSGGLDHLTSPIRTIAASADRPGLTTMAASSSSFPQLPPLRIHHQNPNNGIEADVSCVATSGQHLAASVPTETFHAKKYRPASLRRIVNPTGGLHTGAGPGKLVVADTRLSGGGQGVQCRGTGALQGVRAIYGAGKMPLFFFEVDARPGCITQQPTSGDGQLTSVVASTGGSLADITRVLASIDPQRMLKAMTQAQGAT